MRILITGAAGRLGRRLTPALEQDHELLLGDITPLDDPRFRPLDVRDPEAARQAVREAEAVIHMAILDWPVCGAEEALKYSSPALQVHVLGTHNMLQATWEGGVRQFVYISSVSAVDGLSPRTRVGPDTRHCSNSIYGLTKGFGEDLCRMYHRSVGLSVAILRLGTIYVPDGTGCWVGNVFFAQAEQQPPLASGSSRVHVDDVTRAIALALHQPAPGYALVHVVGADSGHRWDLDAGRQLYGWAPQYAFGPDGLPVEA